MGMDSGVGIDYGSVWRPGWEEGAKGEKLGTSNSINNKTFKNTNTICNQKEKKRNEVYGYPVQIY